MRKWAALSIFAVVLQGCATAKSWEGRPKSELIEYFGLPTQTLSTAEGEFFQYSKCKSVMIPLGDGFYTGRERCGGKVFLIRNDIVVRETVAKAR